MSDITRHIGSRIRLYRKLLGLTINDLAEKIHKSKSTVSKYETGSVSVDAETLFSIASVLRVSVSKLVDYDSSDGSFSELSSVPKGFFGKPGKYYMYHLSSGSRLLRSLIQLHSPASDIDDFSVEFYNDLTDYKNLHRCRFYYIGGIFFSDLYTNMVFTNQVNIAEKVFITAGNPLNNIDMTLGLVSGISNTFLVPISYKAIFSRTPIDDDETIFSMLRLTKDNIADIRKHNMLILSTSLNTRMERGQDL